jgi:MFS transporter, Spinster family, sphingosine-1-phosphate transporter
MSAKNAPVAAGGYQHYLLIVLLVIQAFNGVDGVALGLTAQNIKADLHLSDTEVGLLSGLAFALFYAVMGIPIARWADRGDRVAIISITAFVWSLLVSLCGAATSFAQLLLIRVGVAVGEAGCVPPAQSLIADSFARGERPRAIAVYMLGGNLSLVIGYFAAGWINQFYGWRITFAALGAPGVVLAALAWTTLREPRRQGRRISDGRSHAACGLGQPRASAVLGPRSEVPTLAQVCATLWSNRTFRHLLFGFSVLYFFGYGVQQWMPVFFIRSYGLKTGEVGTWFALIVGIGGLVGTYAGGALASRYAANNERRQLKAMASAFVLFGACFALMFLAWSRTVAFALMAVATVGASMSNGPLFATLQTLVPARMRAVSIAIIYLFANLIGLGLGPLATGALSDALRPLFGSESLRYALLALCPGYVWMSWHLWRASRTVTDDLAAREDFDPGSLALTYVEPATRNP